jgi:hypothetical protein
VARRDVARRDVARRDWAFPLLAVELIGVVAFYGKDNWVAGSLFVIRAAR